ncbi:hypothetical protein ACFOD4_14955 [Pseudoroseomonas globiformis]|uniref:Uncharacterized protein n=1 Tax=Teichococcus globiformis TaxID=2307229 RepID=A0ABV7G107_9PROT
MAERQIDTRTKPDNPGTIEIKPASDRCPQTGRIRSRVRIGTGRFYRILIGTAHLQNRGATRLALRKLPGRPVGTIIAGELTPPDAALQPDQVVSEPIDAWLKPQPAPCLVAILDGAG